MIVLKLWLTASRNTGSYFYCKREYYNIENRKVVTNMIRTGIIRRFDDSGRITIPKEVRKNVFGENTPIEICYNANEDIVLKPYYEKKYMKLDELKVGDVISFHSFAVGEFLFGIITEAKESDEEFNSYFRIWRLKMLWYFGGIDTISLIKSIDDVDDYKRREFVDFITTAKKLNIQYCLDIDI